MGNSKRSFYIGKQILLYNAVIQIGTILKNKKKMSWIGYSILDMALSNHLMSGLIKFYLGYIEEFRQALNCHTMPILTINKTTTK